MINRTLVILFLLTGYSGYAQNWTKTAKTYFSKLENGEQVSLPSELITGIDNESKSLQFLSEKTADTNNLVRRNAYYLIYKAGLRSDDTVVRKNSVELLTEGLKDQNTVIIKKNIGYLTSFYRSDFSKNASDTITRLLTTPFPYAKDIILLAGFSGTKETFELLKEIKKSPVTPSSLWNINLALARSENQESIQAIKEQVSTFQPGDDFVYVIAPAIIYTHQKELFSILIDELYNDTPQCSSPNPDSDQKILCGYRIMELLAPVIKNYPLEVGPGGDIEGMSYPEALNTVRTWFRENQDYVIDNQIF